MKVNRKENNQVTGVAINMQNTTIFDHVILTGFWTNIYIIYT